MNKRYLIYTALLGAVFLTSPAAKIHAQGVGEMVAEQGNLLSERDISEEFRDLTVKELSPADFPEKIRLWYNPAAAEVIEILMEPKEIGGGKTIRLIRTKIGREENREYVIDLQYGTVAGSRFVVYLQDGEKLRQLGEIDSLELMIPGDGLLYSSGPVSGVFQERRAYVVEENAVCEVEHPIMYREDGTVTRKDATLYADGRMTDEIGRIPASSTVTILLRQGDVYLIRTKSGRIGWARSSAGIRFEIR
ncbi:MAG: hypothetical protein ACYC9O_03000 [Candidatus Latescibacterota bacterium]